MGSEPPPGRGSAFGDEVVPVTRTEEESERLSRDYARQAQQDHPAVVTHIRTAFDLVLDDLGVGAGSGAVEALWMPSEMEHEVRPWTFHNSHRDLPGDWWRGLIYLHGQRQLTIEIDASRPDTQLPYYIAFAIQDSIQEEFGGPRPACPLHGHALRPSGTLTGSVWECPDDGKLWWCRMGEYRQALTSG